MSHTHKHKHKHAHNKTHKHQHKHAHNKTHKAFRRAKCSPKNSGEKLDYSCYTASALHKLKEAWNARHPDEPIDTNNPRQIWERLRKYMGDSCESEMCWIRHQCLKHNMDTSLLSDMFAPTSPEQWKKNPQEWLTTVDIQKVMSQWEKADKDFKFLGPSPIDYDTHQVFGECVWEEICKFDIKDTIKKGKKKIGLIFNLDKHTQPGSHWVALYIDIPKEKIYYFDSYGDDIPKQIHKFAKTVKQQGAGINMDFDIKINKKRHQYSETECGMYSLYFIIQLLHDTQFKTFQLEKVPDRKMIRLRKEYFNSHA
jgi:hypothetical protein